MTPLMVAAERGNIDSVRVLLDRKVAPVDSATPERMDTAGGHGAAMAYRSGGETALMLAARSGHVEVVRLLLDHRANPNRKSNASWTSLAYARFGQSEATVRLLKERGAVE